MPELESIKNETWSILSSVALGTTSSKAAAGNEQRLTSGATRSVWLDCNRLDTYTANGSPDRPFKTLSETTSYWISAATGASMYMVYGTYSAGAGISLPAYPLTIDGNGSTITYTGTFTINANFVRRNLNTSGGTTIISAGTTTFYAGSVGALTVQSGATVYLYGVVITGNLTINSGAVVYKDFSTVVQGSTINNGTLYTQLTQTALFASSKAMVSDETGALASSSVDASSLTQLSTGTCSTGQSTVAKVVTLTGYTPHIGDEIRVTFTYASVASATLNVNSTGAYAIYANGSIVTSTSWSGGDTVGFKWDGTYWHIIWVKTPGYSSPIFYSAISPLVLEALSAKSNIDIIPKQISGMAYTLDISDDGQVLEPTHVSGCSFSIPTGVFSNGQGASFFKGSGIGPVTFISESGFSLSVPDNYSPELYGPFLYAHITFTSSSAGFSTGALTLTI